MICTRCQETKSITYYHQFGLVTKSGLVSAPQTWKLLLCKECIEIAIQSLLDSVSYDDYKLFLQKNGELYVNKKGKKYASRL